MQIPCSILSRLALYFPNMATLISLQEDSTVDSMQLKSSGWSEKLQALKTQTYLFFLFSEKKSEQKSKKLTKSSSSPYLFSALYPQKKKDFFFFFFLPKALSPSKWHLYALRWGEKCALLLSSSLPTSPVDHLLTCITGLDNKNQILQILSLVKNISILHSVGCVFKFLILHYISAKSLSQMGSKGGKWDYSFLQWPW